MIDRRRLFALLGGAAAAPLLPAAAPVEDFPYRVVVDGQKISFADVDEFRFYRDAALEAGRPFRSVEFWW